MSETTRTFGSDGEARALDFLERQGMLLLHRNLRVGRSEVDLVMLDRTDTVFVEVKTRSNDAFGEPIEGVTPLKRRALLRAIARYRNEHPGCGRIRIDVVTVLKRGVRWEIGHLRGIM